MTAGALSRAGSAGDARARRAGSPPRRAGRLGLTLVELAVVLCVIGVLAALLLPAVQQAREAARRVQCCSHLKQLALALHGYHACHRVFPPGSLKKGPAFPIQTGWGWGAMILPFLEQAPLFEQIDFRFPTTSGTNGRLIRQPLAIWHCPSDPAPDLLVVPAVIVARGNYAGSAGSPRGRGILYEFSRVRFADLTDGASHTFLLGERANQVDVSGLGSFTSAWCGKLAASAGYLSHSVPHVQAIGLLPVNGCMDFPDGFGSYHAGGVQMALGDGSVHFVSEDIDPDTYEALGSRSGREVVGRF